MRALRVLLRKEFLQIRRDPVLLRMLFIMPLLQLVVLANAATFEVKRSRVWVVDQDRSASSRAVVDRLASTGRFEVVGRSATFDPAEQALLGREADLVVGLPRDFEEDIRRRRHGIVGLQFNAEDGVQAGVSSSYATSVLQAYAAELGRGRHLAASVAAAREAPTRGQPRLDARTRNWYNETLDYHHYMVPGILVQLVTIVGTILTALNIVREKEIGTLDQLNVTPIGRSTFIIAKLLPLWIIALVQLTLGLMVARFIFGVPFEGALPLVYGAAALYLVAALGLGLWISAVVETQQQALFVAFSVLMVYILMSGLFTPIRAMPTWTQWLAQLNPLMHFIALMRAVLLKGAGVAEVWPRLASLAAAGAALMTLAVRQYRKGGA